MESFDVNDKKIGEGGVFIIAEVAQSHDGNINFAHSFIDAAADAGASAIKFQTHIAEAETTIHEPWRIKFSRQDDSRYSYWKRMEFSESAWCELMIHAKERGLVFLSSPFSFEAFDLLEKIGVPAWKVASGEIGNIPLLERLVRTGKPILLSSGMSSWEELDSAVSVVRSGGNPLAVFQCTTSYPCPPERIGLNVLQDIKERYGCLTGLSDHSATIYSGLAAVALGASLLELHVTFHKKIFGPDVPASITFEELSDLVRGANFINTALSSPVDKEVEYESSSALRGIFTKSILARCELNPGDIITSDLLSFKKPGNGIAASQINCVLGKKIKVKVVENTPLKWSDFE